MPTGNAFTIKHKNKFQYLPSMNSEHIAEFLFNFQGPKGDKGYKGDSVSSFINFSQYI